MKRNTALVKRLRQLNEDAAGTILEDIARTNQSKVAAMLLCIVCVLVLPKFFLTLQSLAVYQRGCLSYCRGHTEAKRSGRSLAGWPLLHVCGSSPSVGFKSAPQHKFSQCRLPAAMQLSILSSLKSNFGLYSLLLCAEVTQLSALA